MQHKQARNKQARTARYKRKPMLGALLLSTLLAACGPTPESEATVQTGPPETTIAPAPAEAEAEADGAEAKAKAAEATSEDVPAEILAAYDEADSLQGLAAARFFRSVASPDFVHTTLYGQQEALNPYIAQMQRLELEDFTRTHEILNTHALESDEMRLKLRLGSLGTVKINIASGLSYKTAIEDVSEVEDTWQNIDGQWQLAARRSLSWQGSSDGEAPKNVTAIPAPNADELEAQRAAVREILQPLSSLEADTEGTDDLAWLAPYGAARLVALGEGSHGTNEHFELKARLFRTLAEEYGFSALIMEWGQGNMLEINEWIQGGDNDVAALVRQPPLSLWGQPLYDLFAWMREKNMAGQQPPFQVFGIDARGQAGTARALYDLLPEGDAKRVAAGLIQMDVGAWQRLDTDAEKRTEVLADIDRLTQQVAALPGNTPQLDDIRYVVQLLEQGGEAARHRAEALDAGNTGAINRYSDYTNEMMAENATWLLEHTLEGQKAALWAHNGHAAQHGRNARSIGEFLQSDFSNNYQVLCLGLGEGEVMAYGANSRWSKQKLLPPVPYQLNGLAATVLKPEQPAGYISLQDLQAQPTLQELITGALPFSQIGNTYIAESGTYADMTANACNGYVFIKNSTPTQYVEAGE